LEDKVNKISLVGVRGGVFEMGCKAGRDDKTDTCGADATLHWVKVNDFKIGKYEVTQAQWKAVMGWLPGPLTGILVGDDKPITYVGHYYDIVGPDGFIDKLNKLTGKNYRLPTEAEWEYAARGCEAGNCESFEFSGSDNLSDVGWNEDNHPDATAQPVGGKLPNALGIYDMSGNAFEWCNEWYGSTYYPSGTTQDSPQDNPTGPEAGPGRVVRGGSWNNPAHYLHVALRHHTSGFGISDLGFRVVLP
jgi:formylglycine-generating enzyme required for sulfatase activity